MSMQPEVPGDIPTGAIQAHKAQEIRVGRVMSPERGVLLYIDGGEPIFLAPALARFAVGALDKHTTIVERKMRGDRQ